jgi:hypothetical protein
VGRGWGVVASLVASLVASAAHKLLLLPASELFFHETQIKRGCIPENEFVRQSHF